MSSVTSDLRFADARSRRRAARMLAIAAVAMLIALLPLLSGLIGAVILAVLAWPLYRRLCGVAPKSIAAVLVTIAVFVGLLLPAIWLASTIVSETISSLREWTAGGGTARWATLRIAGFAVAGPVARLGTALLNSLSGKVGAITGNVTSALYNSVIALLGLYYLLRAGPSAWSRSRAVLPVAPEIADALARRFVDVTYALVLGTGLAAFVQGVTVGAVFSIVGLRPAVLWGFVTMCAAILPVLGAALVWLPGAVFLALDGRIVPALVVAGVGLIITSNIDNVVRMLVYRRVSGIHPLLTLVGAFAGLRLFGIIGVFLGPLLLSYFFQLVALYEDQLARPSARPD